MSIPATQLNAWQQLQATLGAKQQLVLNTVRQRAGGLTAFEVAARLHLPINYITGRIRELHDKDLVRDSGKRRINHKSKRQVIVWEFNPQPQPQPRKRCAACGHLL